MSWMSEKLLVTLGQSLVHLKGKALTPPPGLVSCTMRFQYRAQIRPAKCPKNSCWV